MGDVADETKTAGERGGSRLRVLVVDDEPPARQRLVHLIGEIDWVEVVGEAGSGDEALAKCDRLAPDALLLDIHMPGLDGLATATVLAERPRAPSVIFTTAHDEYALAAFEARALDYLLKPIRRARLVSALERVRDARTPAARNDAPEAPGDEPSRGAAAARRRQFTAQIGHQVRSVPVEQVYYLRADAGYVEVGHAGGELVINDSLARLAEEFATEFLRIHRKTLVAPGFVRGLERRGSATVVVLDDGTEFEVSRRLLAAVKARLYG